MKENRRRRSPPQKEAPWADLTKTKPEEGRGITKTNTPPQDKICLLDPLGRTKRRKVVTKIMAVQNKLGGDDGNIAASRGTDK